MEKIHLLIAVFMLMLLTACGTDKDHGEPPVQAGTEGEENTLLTEHTYEKEAVLCSEPSKGFSFRKDLEKTQTDYAAYYFEAAISVQERDTCIAVTDRVLSLIEGTVIEGTVPEIEIVVLRPEFYDGVLISGNRLYLPPQSWDSADYLAKVLLAGYGEWGNYGIAYGYADYLCRKAGLNGGEENIEEQPREESTGQKRKDFLPMSIPEAYDLNLLCFNERFVSAEDVEAAKNNACLFVENYLSAHSEEEYLNLLSASGTAEGEVQAKEALEAFYEENGVECSLTGIRYQFGGVAADYAAICDYAGFYVYKDWQDMYWEKNPMVSENFLHEDYKEVRKFFECNEHQMRQYQELFGFDCYDNSLLVLIQNFSNKSTTAFYRTREHTIYLNTVSSLMHEYIHSVTYGNFEDWTCFWKIEGFATYFSYKYGEYAYDLLNGFVMDISSRWIQEYTDTLGRPIDVRTDFYDGFVDIMIYANGLADPNDTYEAGASFIHYLVGQYGEQAVIAYVASDHEYNTEWDKSYDELVQDWNQFIEENYSQYSKNYTADHKDLQ